MKSKVNLFYIVVILLVSGCLPQEKTTQCDSNEAYDAKRRACVATQEAGSSVFISGVTPSNSYTISTSDASKTHSISVTDPYNAGYQIRWYLTEPTGNTLLLGTSSTLTFTHTGFSVGSYVLEVQLLDSNASKTYDSRSWTVNIIDDATPTISASTPTPLTTTITSSSSTLNATANNPDLIGAVDYQWYVNGIAIPGESGTFSTSTQALSFSFDPTSSSSYYAGSGIYSVQVVLSEFGTSNNYDTYTWSITNNIPSFANVSLATSGTYATLTPGASSLITNLDSIDISSTGFLYDTDSNGTLDGVDFCLSVDDITGVDSDGVYVDFLLDGVLIPGISKATPNNQFTTNNSAFCLGDIVSTFDITLVDSTVSESHTITAVVYDGYSGATNKPQYNGGTEIDRKVWQIRSRPQNTAPTITIDSTNTTTACSTQTTTTYSNCTITQDTSFDVAITVTDEDYDPEDYTSEYGKFRVEFYLEDDLLDGVTHDLSSSDCEEDYNETANSSRYICSLTINSYDSNGPISVTGLNYKITAKVIDADSPYSGGADPQTSNTVTWNVDTVNDINSGITLNPFNTASTADSYISTQATPGSAIDYSVPGIVEGDVIQFHVEVDDPERDSHTIKIERCADVACATVIIPALQTSTVNSLDDTNPRSTAINHQVSEDAVTGTNQDNVFYRITVTDTDGASDSEIITVVVTNNNPDPDFDVSNFDPSVSTALIAFTGFPLTIDPGTITDASESDGDTIEYQWVYSTDGGTSWVAIDGATEKVLVWSPGPELDFVTADDTGNDGQAVKLKLCLGDDGVDNAGADKDAATASTGAADCNSVSLDTSGGVAADAWDVTVYSNMTQSEAYFDNQGSNTSNGPVAVWTDSSSTSPVVTYSAYVNLNNEIIVDKIVTVSDGTKGGSVERTAATKLASIKFDASTDASFSSNEVTYLSMTGDTVNKALYIAYMTPVSGVDQVHIRRIDISGGKTAFVHDGKFGWDAGYNDLTDNIIITGGGMDPETLNAATGQVEITITDNPNNTNMSINFNGISGGSVDLVSGTDFCNPITTCTTTSLTATELATAINDSDSTELQGITASAVGSVVTLEGIVEGDYIQSDVGATRIGSIVVNQTNAKWQLPLIDHDLAGADKNKLSILEGDLNIRLDDANISKTSLATQVEPAQELANALDVDDDMIIAIKHNTNDNIYVYELSTAYTVSADTNTDLFNDSEITGIKLAVSQESSEFEPSAFIVGKDANSRFSFARIDSVGGDFDLANAIAYSDLDTGFELFANMNNYSVSAGGSQYQALVAIVSDHDSDTFYDVFLVNITGNVPSADCSYDSSDAQNVSKCAKLATAAVQNSFDLPVALGTILEDVTIGDAGATSGENTNDVLPVVFHVDDGGGSPSLNGKVIQGLLNATGADLSANATNANKGHIIPYVSP